MCATNNGILEVHGTDATSNRCNYSNFTEGRTQTQLYIQDGAFEVEEDEEPSTPTEGMPTTAESETPTTEGVSVSTVNDVETAQGGG